MFRSRREHNLIIVEHRITRIDTGDVLRDALGARVRAVTSSGLAGACPKD
jgi:hypothetical protein